MRSLAFLALLLLLAATACTPRARSSSDLEARDTAWAKAFNAGDLDALTAIYSEDARLLAPNAAMSQGRTAIHAALAEMTSAGLKGTLKTIEATASGDIGYNIGTYEMRDPKGTVVDRGKFAETFRRVGGQWQITNDTWNSDTPVNAAAAEQMIIVHEVKDDARWFDAWNATHGRRENFARHGAPRVTIFSSPDRPKYHALLVDIADMDAFRAWSGSPEVAAARAEDGVVDEGFTMFTPQR
jgi:ketosteroid isomerase-like protein